MLGVVAVTMSEPQSGPANTYLPPDQTGYEYNRPSVPFPSTAPGPQPIPNRPNLPPTGPSRPSGPSGGGVSNIRMFDFKRILTFQPNILSVEKYKI